MTALENFKTNGESDIDGIVLVHEHVFNRFPHHRKEESENFTLNELNKLVKYGVHSIVDLTPYTNLGSYEKIFKNSNIKIHCCTGFYLAKYIPHPYKKLGTSELVKKLTKHVEHGRGKLRIIPSVLKVAGQKSKMTELEVRCFKAIAIVHQQYKLPIVTHSPNGALAHFKVLVEAGANPEKILFSHLDKGLCGEKFSLQQRIEDIEYLLNRGAYILFSEFGSSINIDTFRLRILKKILLKLKAEGYLNQLCISADCNWRWKNGHLRIRDSHLGGVKKTYEYVFTRIIPFLKGIGFSETDIKTMLVHNPNRFLGISNQSIKSKTGETYRQMSFDFK